MKVTKYPQSCLLLEKGGKRIVIDPGNLFAAKYSAEELGELAAVLYTHQHPDHFDKSLMETFKKQNVPIYANQDVCSLIGDMKCNVAHSSGFEIAGFDVMPHDLPHCKMVDGSEGPPNTGYIIDGNFFHPGDGTETTGVAVENLAVAIAGPDVTMHDATNLALAVEAKRLIPMHYDNTEFFPGSPKGFATAAKDWFNLPFEVIVLADGESTEL